jgi:hypothetical protein
MLDTKQIAGLWYHGGKYNRHSGSVVGVVGEADHSFSFVMVDVHEADMIEVPTHRRIVKEQAFIEFRLYVSQQDWENDKSSVLRWWQE